MRRFHLLLLALIALAVPGNLAHAALSDYLFSTGTGSTITPSYTTVWAGTQRGRASYAGQNALINLPFTFFFNGVGYTQLRLTSHGLIGFGSASISTSYSNSMPSAASAGPVMTALWDRFYIAGPAPSYCNNTPRIRYGTSGTSPGRIFVIDYDDISVGYAEGTQYGPQFQDWQVRLYEGTNIIEFYYSNARGQIPTCLTNWGTRSLTTSSSIGLAASTSDFMSVTPVANSSSANMSRTSFDNSVNTGNTGGTPIAANTIYRFTPCNMDFIPNLAQGGVTGMASGSVLMSGISLQRGATATYQPFTITLTGTACAARNLTITLGGPNAADYTVSPIGAQVLAANSSMPVNVTFTPQSIGVRTATLTITDQFGASRIFTLQATGLPRVSWTPDLSQGGTPTLTNGDTLMKDFIVRRAVIRDFTPITLLNFSTNGAIPPAVVTVSIDSAGGISTQYQLITPSTVSLGPGQSYTPIIRFLGSGLGPQNARITINADGEIRSFPMKVISGAPGIAVTALGMPADANNPVFNQQLSCVGEYATSIPLLVNNPGQFPLVISSIDLYQTDTTTQQGTPYFQLLRDAQGRPIRMTDYVISSTPGVVPLSSNPPVALPITIDPGQTRTLYATFVGQIPGKRFGRAFIRTNAENVFGTDTTLNGTPNSVLGLLAFDFVGRAIGSQLAANATGLPMKTVSFPGTRIGDTAVMSFTIANSGACDLRINRNKLRIYSGDVNEFRLMTSLRRATLDAATGDWVLAPGMVDTLTVRFTPSRSGTRMATLWIQTNDSTISKPGLIERGSYYLDLTGRGLAGLDASGIVLDPVVIGSFVNGVATLENTLNTSVGIGSISYLGGDAAEFSEDPSVAWPTLPTSVLPGQKLQLGVRLSPVGSAGPRRTTLILVTTNGDTIRVPVRGEAGTQELQVSPNSLFETVTIAVGQTKRQSVMISNTGTLPVRITGLSISGPDSASYRLGSLPRRDLEAGQTEYLELTYVPTAPGQTSADLVVTASNGMSYTVTLGGTALKIRRDPIDPAMTGAPNASGTPEAVQMGRKAPALR
ncbi:MAG TPA: choice-of-anchor D domain-containing protein [Candidatus Kapabacteria bacterium]|nr:choice-of-anchor D domain-containing protein [Candidatus Kapabacteria bacterium]